MFKNMVSSSIWIGIVIGVFFAGIGLGFIIFEENPPVNQENQEIENLTNLYKDFLEPIILVFIPTIIVAVMAPRVTKSWQFRATKINMKKEVLESFAKSATYQANAMHQFIGRLLNYYGKHDLKGYDEEKGISSIKFTVPSDPKLLPNKLFNEGLSRLQEQLDQSKLIYEPIFVSLLHLYYRRQDFIDEYIEIQKKLGKLKNIVYNLVDVTTAGEMSSLGEPYYVLFREIKDMIPKLREKLVTGEIIIPEKEKPVPIKKDVEKLPSKIKTKVEKKTKDIQ